MLSPKLIDIPNSGFVSEILPYFSLILVTSELVKFPNDPFGILFFLLQVHPTSDSRG